MLAKARVLKKLKSPKLKERKMQRNKLRKALKNKPLKQRTTKLPLKRVKNENDRYIFYLIEISELKSINIFLSLPLQYCIVYKAFIVNIESKFLLVKSFIQFLYLYNFIQLPPRRDILMQRQLIEVEQNNTVTLFNMFENQKYENLLIRSISKQLDQFFQGGLHKGVVTQVYGEAGSGKSQLAMFYALGAISRNIPCCFLSTQKQLSWNRFTGIAYTFMNQAQFQEYQKNFIYKKTSDFLQGYMFIEESMKKIKQKGKGGLLVIDSIHGFIMNCIQQNNIQNDIFQKCKKQAQIVNRLRWIAKMSGSAVLLINHAAEGLDKVRRASSGRGIVPSLGSSWQLNIDQNIYLTRKKQIRQLSVIFSPKISTNKRKRFRIDNEGFTWISQDGVEYKK